MERLEDRLAPSGDFGYALSLGGTGSDQASEVATDGTGNVYVTGQFQGTVDFDPDPANVVNLTSAGLSDAFLAKFSPSGALVWARKMGGTVNDRGTSLAVDAAGDVVVAGDFAGTASFGALPNLVSAEGTTDAFLTQLDGSGNFIWAKRVGGPNVDTPRDVAVDAQRNIYVVGDFAGTVDFDPDAGTATRTPLGTNTLSDVFVLKLTPSGTYTWVQSFGASSAPDLGQGIAVDGAGNVYTTGVYRGGTNDFDPGPGTASLPFGGNSDAFVSKLDATGALVWAKGFGAGETESASAIAVDAAGNAFLAGTFAGTVDFNPDPAVTFNLASEGTNLLGSPIPDVYIAKLDSAGGLAWAGRVGGMASPETVGDLTLDLAGNVYIAGSFNLLADLDPDPTRVYALTGSLSGPPAAASIDSYVLKLDNDGHFVWARDTSGLGTESAAGIATDVLGHVYAVGFFAGTSDFDPDPVNVANRTSAGATAGSSFDGFLFQLSSGTAVVQPAAADGYAIDATNDGTFEAADTTGGSIWTRDNSSPRWRGLMEFDLTGLTPGLAVRSATLTVRTQVLEHNDLQDGVDIAIYGYSGDGTITPADGAASAILLGQALNVGLGTLTITLDPAAVQALLAGGSKPGLMVRLLRGDGIALASSESPLDAPPTLTLDLDQAGTRPPRSRNDAYYLDEDTTLTVPLSAGVLDNDDTDRAALTATLLSGPQQGTLTFNPDGTFSYTPPPNFAASSDPNSLISFTYRANDGTADGNVATVFLIVNPVNDAPTAVADSYTTNEDVQMISAPSLLLNDTDIDSDRANFTAILESGPSHGTLFLFPDGTFNYRPATDYNGSDSFTYRTKDGQALSAPVTVSITVNPVNDAPEFILVVGTATANEDAGASSFANYTINIRPGPTTAVDEAGQVVHYVLTITGSTGGLTFSEAPAIGPDGTLTFTSAPNSNGTATLRAVLVDNGGTSNGGVDQSGFRTFTIVVNAVNDAPTAVADSYSTNSGVPLSVPAPGMLANDLDVEGENLTSALVAAPQYGVLTLNTNGSFSYTPSATYVGLDSFSYMANDGKADSNVVTVTFRVGPDSSASFVTTDTTTQGTWKSVYGSDGFVLAQDPSGNNPTLPSYATVSLGSRPTYTWSANSSDPRALQQAANGSTNRIAATWSGSVGFSIDVSLNDGQTHRVALYAMDWDNAHRTETVEVIDALTGTVLDTHTLANFQDGAYLVWNLKGHVRLKITNTGPANAVATALFFGDAGLAEAPAAVASFVTTDTATQGTWKGAYGSDGFVLAQDPSGNNPTLPSYATVSLGNLPTYTWNANSSDPRALQQAANGSTNRIAATWSGSVGFSIDVSLNDGQTHRVALYAMDWDNAHRTETVEVIDIATGTVLDTRTLANFQDGAYLVWNLKGHVRLKITNTGPANAVATALFFGDAGLAEAPAAVASFVTTDTATQGTWKGAYGSDGFVLAQDPSGNNPTLPSYATVSLGNLPTYTWNANSSDPRALQQAANGSTNRIAATWSGSVGFSIDVSLNDGQTHRVALYAMDWDNAHRTETVEVIDALTGAVLDTRTLANFQDGAYLVWNLKGNVRLKITNTGPANAVATALFFG